jgi:hypothetical protein
MLSRKVWRHQNGQNQEKIKTIKNIKYNKESTCDTTLDDVKMPKQVLSIKQMKLEHKDFR